MGWDRVMKERGWDGVGLGKRGDIKQGIIRAKCILRDTQIT